MAKTVLLYIVYLFLTAVSGPTLPIIDVSQTTVGGNFHVTCNVQRVNIPQNIPSSSPLSSLSIVYQQNIGPPPYQNLAELSISGSNTSQIKNIPRGRNWDVIFTVGNVTKRDTVTVELLANDVSCEDSGHYGCQVMFLLGDGGRAGTSEHQELAVSVAAARLIISLDPIFFGPPGWKNQSTYELGTNVTVTCIAEGPASSVVQWKREIRPAFAAGVQYEDYPNQDDITTDEPILVRGLCRKYYYKSTLKFNISHLDNHRCYRCSILRRDAVVGSASVLVDLLEVSGSLFTIVCDASQVTFPAEDVNVTDVYSMKIDVMKPGAGTYTNLARYVVAGPQQQTLFKNIPPDRNWTITFSGDNNGKYNRNSMKIQLVINDIMCTDAGSYRCVINYMTEKSGLKSLMKVTNVTDIVLPDCMKINRSPQIKPPVFMLLPALAKVVNHFVW